MLWCMVSRFSHRARVFHGQWPALAWSTGPEILGQVIQKKVYNKKWIYLAYMYICSRTNYIDFKVPFPGISKPSKEPCVLQKIIDEIIINEWTRFFLNKQTNRSYNICTFFQFNSLYFREETGRICSVECGFFNSYDSLNFVIGVCVARKGALKDDRMSKGIFV